jgi:hypothetical protein
MLNIDEEKDNFILIDGQGSSFGGGRIFESIKEVAEQFQDWADVDDYEDPELKGWTISYCLENWTMEMKEYNGADFVEPSKKFLDYKL